jgi:hypothetical protein
MSFLVYFPTFVLSVDTTINCHLSFEPFGRLAPLAILHYFQPWCPLTLYPSEVSPSLLMTTSSPAFLAVMEDDVSTTLPNMTMALPDPSTPPFDLNLGALLTHLKGLADAISKLSSSPSSLPLSPPPTQRQLWHDDQPVSGSDDEPTSHLLSTMSPEEIACLLHHPSTSFPSV